MAFPYSAASDYLNSSAQRNTQAMTSPVPFGANAQYDGASNAAYNRQPLSNTVMNEQSQVQNVTTGAPQAAADAMAIQRNMINQGSEATAKAERLRDEFKAQALYANDSGSAINTVNSLLQSPEGYAFKHSMNVGKLTARGVNPDLGALQSQENQYS